MFSCEFCEISKNTFFAEHLRATASGFGSVEMVFQLKRPFVINKLKKTYYTGDMLLTKGGSPFSELECKIRSLISCLERPHGFTSFARRKKKLN